ncbi:Uncharacterised protein [Staphylococcus argenteus]|nr:Uncharacterised protein [Staphylococcus argenteus]
MIAHLFILFYTMTDNIKEVQQDEKVNQQKRNIFN